jgi:hypothetical protein
VAHLAPQAALDAADDGGVALSGMAPITGYRGPGPERMLSDVTAEVTMAAFGRAKAVVMTAAKIVFLSCMAQTSD